MPVPIRTEAEIDGIARAGEIGARALAAGFAAARPGASTREVDRAVEREIRAAGARAIFRGLRPAPHAPPFSGVACVCLNEEAVHAVPRDDRLIRAGDLLTIDTGIELDAWCADLAWTEPVAPGEGPAPGRSERLASAARAVVEAALAAIAPGVRWSAVSAGVLAKAQELGFDLIPGFAGHGIGRRLHEPPRARLERPAVEPGSDDDFTLRPGMVLTVEPILTEPVRTEPEPEPDAPVRDSARHPGTSPPEPPATMDMGDGWTVATRGGGWACHEERTVAVVRGGCRVLTPRWEVVGLENR